MLAVGDRLPAEIGATLAPFWSREELRALLLYFYPKDGTPGCTQQACSLRDSNQELIDAGVAVVGVSGDSEVSHRKFVQKHQLNFPLIADTNHELAKAFGVYKPKRIFGKEVLGTVRASFLIDRSGEIIHVWTKLNTVRHGAEVLAQVEQLGI